MKTCDSSIPDVVYIAFIPLLALRWDTGGDRDNISYCASPGNFDGHTREAIAEREENIIKALKTVHIGSKSKFDI